MSSSLGKHLRVQIFGQSHSEGLGVVIDGLPAGHALDMEEIARFLETRAGGKAKYSTPRRESDTPHVLSGIINGRTCGAPLCATFENKNVKPGDYADMALIPRPSHADYTAFVKHRGHNDPSGGGHFSGRLTLPLCFAGAVCLQLLRARGVFVGAHIYRVGDVCDTPFDPVGLTKEDLQLRAFPTLSPDAGMAMVARMEETAGRHDSIGGVVECGVLGFPAGLGDPMFDTLEGRLSYALFGIPAVKGVEFGTGFALSQMYGHEANDAFTVEDGRITTTTNHGGGILGGISNGMPLIFRAAVKPTPSIFLPQPSVNLESGEAVTLLIQGRHDPCIVPRAVPCVAAATAIVLYDILLGGNPE